MSLQIYLQSFNSAELHLYPFVQYWFSNSLPMNMQYITILHRHTNSESIWTHSILLNTHIPSLTSEPIDNGWPLILLFFLRSCAVLSIHFADRRGAFALNLRVKLLVEQNLVYQVRLHWAGLCRGFWGAIIITCKGTKIKVKEKKNQHFSHSALILQLPTQQLQLPFFFTCRV